MTTTPAPIAPPGDSPRGLLLAASAYFLWGLMPLLMKALAHVPATEVLVHRVIWALPIAGAVLWATGRTADLKRAIRSPRTVAMAALTAAIISVNWGIYVWAIAADRAVETALGYYINPLMTVLIGATLLGERLTRLQIVAVLFAAAAVVIMTVSAGGVPWVSLALAGTFAAYGYFKKTLPIGPSQGFFLEIVILLPFALGWLAWLTAAGDSRFGGDDTATTLLLLVCGPITAIPLLLYAFGAKLLRISTIGILQYIAPTMIVLFAVFAFGEPFGLGRLVAFALIWTALGIYTWSMFAERRAANAMAAAPGIKDAVKDAR